MSKIQIGDQLAVAGEQFVKYNDSNLLMMSSTLTCPHGKKIAGQWVRCYTCDAERGYFDYANITCACEEGFFLRPSDNACITCPAYGYYDSVAQSCVCPIGYQYNAQTDRCDLSNVYSEVLDTYYDSSNCENPIGWLQDWNDCGSLNQYQTVCLVDQRDHRSYNVAQLGAAYSQWSSSNICWMVEPLSFGGEYESYDACTINGGEGNFTTSWCTGQANCSAGGASSAAKGAETFVFHSNYYGHCRASTGSYIDNYFTGQTIAYNNYVYDWVAVLQDPNAFYGNNNYYPSSQIQGLCPIGWHVATGGTSGEVATLSQISPSNALIREMLPLSGGADGDDGSLYGQGQTGYMWTATKSSSDQAANFSMDETGNMNIYGSWYPNHGYTIHCVKN
ncbi:hypothetical protein IJJ27_00310 [bacterium]|nr:hypothetical protein [bacterium]